MAKSGKKTFRESTADYAALAARIAERRFEPLYLLMGDEPYFIDSLTARLADAILPPDERAFNQTVVYGKDTDAGAVINLCRQMPMTGTRQVVIVREAQSLRRLEQLSLYTASPCATTILVLCHKERNMDKRSQLYKQIAGRGVVFESVRPRDYEIAGWLAEYIRSRNCTIDAKSVSMLVDHLGADIAKIANEIDKLMTFLPEGTSRITAEHIEQNIGISKDFNNFELTRALSEKDMARALRIADHFARNPKENPLLVTLGTLFTHFQRIFIVNYQRWLCRRKGTPMPPDAELARMLKLSSAFFLKEYQQAASLYPNSRGIRHHGADPRIRSQKQRDRLGTSDRRRAAEGTASENIRSAMTFILIFLTAVVSVVCFGNRRWFDSLAMIPYRVAHDRQWYRAVTYGFVHADYMHLIVNMFVLLSFGQYLERLFRAYEHAGTIASGYLAYGLLYFGGLIASVASDMARHRNDPRYVSIGASGAVSAVVFASIFFNPWSKIYFFGILPIPGILFGALYVGYEQYLSQRGGDNVNHNAHLWGALYGFVFPLLLEPSLWHAFIRNLTQF